MKNKTISKIKKEKENLRGKTILLSVFSCAFLSILIIYKFDYKSIYKF
jgi:hypothetical protein